MMMADLKPCPAMKDSGVPWLGESLFAQVFPKADADPDPRAFYHEAVRAGLEQCKLCVSSEDTEFLNIPWELIRDPSPGRGYLAPLLGGLIGILLGVGIAKLVDTAGVMRAVVSPTPVLLAVGFSLTVGLFFGIYPANRAGGLSPIEVLRYE